MKKLIVIGALALLGTVSCKKADAKTTSEKDTVNVVTEDTAKVVTDSTLTVEVDTLKK